MTAITQWTLLPRERARPAFAPTPPRKGKATCSSAKVSAWENEGGSLAIPAEAPRKPRGPDYS